jgi:hypothetical protein
MSKQWLDKEDLGGGTVKRADRNPLQDQIFTET